jgi:tetratricopeptide (TPR) repeat protein
MLNPSQSLRTVASETDDVRKAHARSEEDLRAMLEEGLKAEKAGVLDRAESLYREVAEEATTPTLIAEVLLRRSHVHRSWGMSAEAIRLAQQGRGLARQAQAAKLEAELLNAEGAVHQSRGDFDEADRLFGSMLALTEDPRIRGIALQNLGGNAGMRGDLEEAERCFRDSSELFARAGYRRGEAFCMNNHGRVLLDRGNFQASRPVLDKAVALAGEVQDMDLLALARLNLAEALLALGALEQAQDCAAESLGYFTGANNPWRTVDCLRTQGDISVRMGEKVNAARCYERALELAGTLQAKVEMAELQKRLRALKRVRPESGS